MLYSSCFSCCCCCCGHSGGGGGAVALPLGCCCRDAYTAVAAAVHVLVAQAHLTVGEARYCAPPASWAAAAAVVDAAVAVVVLLHSFLGTAVAYAAVVAAVQVLVALAHLTVGKCSAVPLRLFGLLLLWWTQRWRLVLLHSLSGAAAVAYAAVAATVQVLVALAHLTVG